jgi:hypothetical protein
LGRLAQSINKGRVASKGAFRPLLMQAGLGKRVEQSHNLPAILKPFLLHSKSTKIWVWFPGGFLLERGPTI